MSKYCPRCGAATERNAAFCQNCGAKIPQEQPPASKSHTN
ncbi:MAG: zinc-ribbon domain-containing protein, partial [Acutalibacteraceae bacterium]